MHFLRAILMAFQRAGGALAGLLRAAARLGKQAAFRTAAVAMTGMRKAASGLGAQLARTRVQIQVGFGGSNLGKSVGRLTKLRKSVTGLASALSGSSIIQGALQIATETASLAHGLGQVAKNSGLAVGAVQELRYVGEAAGLSVEQVDDALTGFSQSVAAAAAGDETLAQIFEDAGISLRDADGQIRSSDDLLMEFADHMASLSSDGERAALGMQLMGDNGAAMAAALKGGAAEVGRLREEAQSLGLIEEKLVDDSSQFVKMQQRLSQAFLSVKAAIASALLPALTEIAGAWLEWYQLNREWINQKLETFALVLANAFRLVGDVALWLIQAIEWVGSTFGGLTDILLPVGIAVGALALAFGLKAAAIILAFLAIADFIAFLRGKDSFIGKIASSISDWMKKILHSDLSYADHPFLAFLQDIATFAIKTFEVIKSFWSGLTGTVKGIGKVFGWSRGPSDEDASIEQSASSKRRAKVTEEGNHASEHVRNMSMMGLGPWAEPSSQAVGQTNNANVSVEINMSTPEGASSQSVEDAVRRGVGGGLLDAMRGMSPAYSGGR